MGDSENTIWQKDSRLLFQNSKQNPIHHLRGVALVCAFLAEYMDKSYVVYHLLQLVVVTSGVYMGFETDRLLWRITIGNRIDIDIAKTLFDAYLLYMYHLQRCYGDIDVLDIRYFLCDALRRQDMKLSTVKSLLEIYPGYLHLPDRDGSKTPFELACQFASVDIVHYMVELDEKRISYVDDRGNTPLHWACQRRSHATPPGSYIKFQHPVNASYLDIQGPDVVNYLLEKRMSLVTVTNKNGDLPIHVANDRMKNNWTMHEPQRIEIVWRLLLAYPDCLNCVGGSTRGSNDTDIQSKKNR